MDPPKNPSIPSCHFPIICLDPPQDPIILDDPITTPITLQDLTIPLDPPYGVNTFIQDVHEPPPLKMVSPSSIKSSPSHGPINSSMSQTPKHGLKSSTKYHIGQKHY